MFEGALEQLLLQFLAPYVDGISRDKLHLGAFSGSLELKDLKVKADALTLLGLEGFRVRHGSIKLIKVSVPWSRIYSGKLCVTVEHVHVEVETMSEGRIAEAQLIKEMQEAKRKAIEVRFNQLNDLMERQDDGQEHAVERSQKRGMVVRLVRKIVNNITVYLVDVSLSFINNNRKLACSLEFPKLGVLSTDHTFSEGRGAEVVDIADQSMYKLMHLQELGLRMSSAGSSDIRKAQYVLSPISASLQLAHVPKDQVLRVRLEVATAQLAEVTLRRSQVKHARSVQAELSADALHLRALVVPPEEERKIYMDVGASRSEYARLYERHLLRQWRLPAGGAGGDEEQLPTEGEERRRQVLEDVFSTRLIARERWRVHRKVEALHSEVARRQEEAEKARLRTERARSGGFFGRLRSRWAGSSSSADAASSAPADDVWLAPEEREQLLEDIGDESKVERVDLPQSFSFDFLLGHMKLELVDDRHDADNVQRQLLSLALKEANWHIDVRMATDHRGQDSAEWSTEIRLKSFQALHASRDLLKLHSRGESEASEQASDDAQLLLLSDSCDAAKLALQSRLGEDQNLLELTFHFQPVEIHLLPGIVESLLEFIRAPEEAVAAAADARSPTAAVVMASHTQAGDSRVEEYVEVSKQLFEAHGDRAKEMAQQVYARIPDRMCLDIRIASPIVHVPVAGLGTSMFSLGQLRVSTPKPCEYRSIDLSIELNHTEMRAVSVRKERFDMIQPAKVAVAVEYRSTDLENNVKVTVKVAEMVLSLAPQAVQILISTPTAIISVLNPTGPSQESGVAASDKEHPVQVAEDPLTSTISDRPSSPALSKGLSSASVEVRPHGSVAGVVTGVLGKDGDDLLRRVEEVRSNQFRLSVLMLFDALHFTLADSIVPVMRFHAEFLQPGFTLNFQRSPSLLTMGVQNGALLAEVLNPRHGGWEPLAERFRFGFEMERHSVGEDGRESRIVVIGHEPVLLNLTPTAVRRASWIVPQFLENLEGAHQGSTSEEVDKASKVLEEEEAAKYRVINICGEALQLSFHSRHSENLTTQVEPTGSQWQPLDDWVLPHFSTALTVSLPGGQPSEALSLERACAVVVPGSGYVAELLAHSPSHRFVLLATPLRVHNRTDLTLSVRFHLGLRGEVPMLEPPAESTVCDAGLLGHRVPGDRVRSQLTDDADSLEARTDGLKLPPNAVVAVPAQALVRENQAGITTSRSWLSVRPASLDVVDSCEPVEVGSRIDARSVFCRRGKRDASGRLNNGGVHFGCESSTYEQTLPTLVELTTVVIQPTLSLLNALPTGELTVKYTKSNSSGWDDAVEVEIPSLTRLNIYDFPGAQHDGINIMARLHDRAPWSNPPLTFGRDAFKREVDATQILKLKQSETGAAASVIVEPLNHLEMRFACVNWFVDRSGLSAALELRHRGELLPRQNGISLLPAECMEEPCELALVSSDVKDQVCAFRMPPSWSVLSWKTSRETYVFCVQADDVASEDVLGAQCQVMTLRPRLVLTNKSPCELELKFDDAQLARLAPGGSAERHWRPKSGEEEAPQCSLQFRPLQGRCRWSSLVLCGDAAAGSIPYILPLCPAAGSGGQVGVEVWTVEVAPARGALAVSFRQGSDFVAVNRSKQADVVIALRPSDCDNTVASLRLAHGGHEVPYGWLKPLQEEKRCSVDVEVDQHTCRVDDVRLSMRHTLRELNLAIIVTPMGTRTLLSVEDYEATAVVDGECHPTTDRSPSSSLSKGVIAGGSSLTLELKLGCLGISVVEEVPVPRELLFLHLDLIRLEWKRDHDLQQLKVAISEAQVDCQLPGRVDQHTLDHRRDESLGLLKEERPAVILANCAEGDRAFFTLIMRRGATSTRAMQIPFMDVAVDALDITVDDAWLDPLVRWIDATGGGDRRRGGVLLEHIQQTAGKSIQVGYCPPPLPLVVQMDHLHIAKVDITMWCALKLKTLRFLPPYMRTAVRVLSLSGQFTLDGALLRLEDRVVPPHRGSLQDFVRGLSSEYAMNLVKNTAAMLGKSSFLNLPRVPLKLGMTSVSYMTDTFGLAFGEASSLLNQLTFDDDYVVQQRQLRSQKNISGVGDGIAEATRSLGQGLEGLLDVVRKPYEGAQKGGVSGFFDGVGKGVVGTFVKPISKLGQAVSDVGSGVAAAVAPKQNRMRPRLRQPRLLFSQAGVVRPWSKLEAELLRQLGERLTKGVEEVVPLTSEGGGRLVLLLFPDRLLLADLQEPGGLDSKVLPPGASRQRRVGDTTAVSSSSGHGGCGGGSSSSSSGVVSGTAPLTKAPAKPERLDFLDAVEESAQRLVSQGLKPINTVRFGVQDIESKLRGQHNKGGGDPDHAAYRRAVRGEYRFRDLIDVVVLDEEKTLKLEDSSGQIKSLSLADAGLSEAAFSALASGFRTAAGPRRHSGVANWDELQAVLRRERSRPRDSLQRASQHGHSQGAGQRTLEVFEVERRGISSWHTASLPTDIEMSWRWLDSSGHRHPHLSRELTREQCAEKRTPPCALDGTLFKPTSNWVTDTNAGTDKDGWKYGITWSSSTWDAQPTLSSFLRRRRWTRTYA